MNNDLISRQQAVDALADMHCKSDEDGYVWIIRSDAWARIDALPSAQPEQDVLAWLLAYHTKSFELHGRYFPHEVISWLVNDFSKEFIAERREEGDLK